MCLFFTLLCTSVHTQFESLFFIAVVNSAGPFIARGYSENRSLESHLSNDAAEEAAFKILERCTALPSQQLQFKGLRFRGNGLMYLSLFFPSYWQSVFLTGWNRSKLFRCWASLWLGQHASRGWVPVPQSFNLCRMLSAGWGIKTWPAAMQNSASDH